MAKKPHKLEWNGVDIDTVLSVSDIHAICAQAAIESTGDLWHGKQRITKADDGAGWTIYVIKDALIGWNTLMVFLVTTSVHAERTQVATIIESFTTLQEKAMMVVPLSSKKMVAHHTYMQFAHKLANTVRAADSTARITIREGVQSHAVAPRPVERPAAPTPPTPPSSPAPPTPPDSAIAAEPAPGGAADAPPPPPPPPPPAPATPTPTPDNATPAIASRAPEQRPIDDRVDDSTIRMPGRPGILKPWELVLPDGASIPLDSPIVVGRDPETNDPASTVVAVPDSELSVSKTHAVFAVHDGVVNVTDLHSRNGTLGVSPDGAEQQCEPGIPLPIQANWTIELGDFAITLRRQGVPR